MRSAQQIMDRAHDLLNRGESAAAAGLYRQIVEKNPDHLHALHFLGVAEAATGNIARARSLLDRSLQASPVNPDFVENYATVLHRAGDYDGVTALCRRFSNLEPTSLPLLHTSAASLLARGEHGAAIEKLKLLLARHPGHFPAHVMLGSALAKTKQYEAALQAYARAAKLNPLFAAIHLDQGTICLTLARAGDALAAYDRAAKAQPDLPEAWLGRCFALIQLGRPEEALAAADKALALKPDFTQACIGRGNALLDLDRLSDADGAYRRVLQMQPDHAAAWTGLGHVALKSGQHKQAQTAFDRALAADPSCADAWYGRALVRLSLGDHDDALTSIDRSIELADHVPAAWRARGQACYLAKRYDEALRDWTRSLALQPDQPDIAAARLRVKMHLCDWSDYEATVEAIRSFVRAGAAVAPLMFIAIPTPAAEQLQCARQWVSRNFRPAPDPATPAPRDHDRIHVAYLSADFHEHATSQLLAGVIEHHDKSRFQITAISVGPDDGSPMRHRMRVAFERFIDARSQGDDEIAELIRAMGVDVLVDLKGYTQGARTGVFALRPAPIQVNYLGFPGSIGADFIDYVVADRHVIPATQREYYAEKVVWLPDSYQANDDRRAMPGTVPARRDHQLGDDSFVFCCFNDNYKLTPGVFSSWMRILTQVENGVLWLFEENPAAAANLRKEAAARGVASDRLVFARRLPHRDHLARLQCADLMLDTLPYGAHTTASDALWVGVPVLTCIGESFAGRVGASLLHALDLPELITTTPASYEALAVALAADPARLTELKARLARHRTTAPLFDTALLTRHLEAAFAAMIEQHRNGLPPHDIDVSAPAMLRAIGFQQ